MHYLLRCKIHKQQRNLATATIKHDCDDISLLLIPFDEGGKEPVNRRAVKNIKQAIIPGGLHGGGAERLQVYGERRVC